MVVTKNIVVSFRYVMKNSRGEVIENALESHSKCYLHGAGGIHSSLQTQFEGLKVGDSKIIYLEKQDGVLDEEFTFDVVIDNLRPASEEEVMLGYPVMSDHLICDSNCICYSGEYIDHHHQVTHNLQLPTNAK